MSAEMNLRTKVLLRGEETDGQVSVTEISFAPRNVAHTLANHSEEPARYVLVCNPAGFERQWARMEAEAAGVEPPAWALQPIPEITVVGPPIAALEAEND